MDYEVKKEEKLIKFMIHTIQGLSFGNAQKLIRLGKVKVNGKRCKENISIKAGDIVNIYEVKKSMPKVDILYEDDNILIVNKPQGIECATRDKSSENTYSLEEIFTEKNAIVVHRLDRLTEGIVILARSKEIAKKFEEYFRLRKIDKHYQAGIIGNLKDSGIKTAYLYKDAKKSEVVISDTPKDNYKEIITEFYPLKNIDNKTIVDIKLHTGRTHQIRSHLSFLGYPIINDSKYGRDTESNPNYKGYFLTAYKIKFNLDDELKYLNDLNVEINPSWLNFM